MSAILRSETAADRCTPEVCLAHVDGRPQLFAGDPGSPEAVQIIDAPNGVDLYEVEPDGRHVWWFAADPDGTGSWRRTVAAAGASQDALRGAPPGRPYGVAFSGDPAMAAIAIGVDGATRCYVGVPGGDGQLILTTEGYLGLVDMADDASLLALAGHPGGPRAACLVAGDGTVVAGLAGGPDRRVWPLEFRSAAVAGPGLAEPQLLLVVEDNGRFTTATWTSTAGLVTHDWISFEVEITAYWYADDGTILVRHDEAGRSHLFVLRPDTRECIQLPVPAGTLHDLDIAADGTISGTCSADGVAAVPVVIRPHEPPLPGRLPAPSGPAGHRRRQLWTDEPYGRIHSFLATPPGDGPWPTLFLIHGGPAVHDRDAFDGRTEFFLAAGYAVVRTNYRGSTGYGARWRRAAYGTAGLAQIEDLGAVRRDLIAAGVSVDGQIGLCGHSWGGYLVLLALGVQPGSWAVGLAAAPIADYPRAYAATTPALQELDRDLLGGSPDEVPERYRAASPLTYVAQVRSPVLITASRMDEKCPPAQIERYVAGLRATGVRHELRWLDGGHHSRDLAEHAATFLAMDRFARAAFAATQADGTPPRTTVPDGLSLGRPARASPTERSRRR